MTRKSLDRTCRFHTLLFILTLLSSIGVRATAQAAVAPPDTLRSAAVDSLPQAPVPWRPVRVTGQVYDGKTGRFLDYTNVVFYTVDERNGDTEFHSGTITLRQGRFYHSLKPGVYEIKFLYLGYEKKVLENLVVEPGKDLDLRISMKIKPIVMQPFVVQGQTINNTEVAALVQQKKSLVVQESLTAEQISRSTDSDAAEALGRVTGLSVVGGKYVFVRGLGDRYSSTSLNGANLSSPEPSRRTVPLDIFPAAMLDNIVVQKTFTPDMRGEFGGGNIDIQTKAAVKKRQFSQKIGYGVNSNLGANGFYSYRSGENVRIFGLDTGIRDLPRAMNPYAATRLPGKKNFLGQGLAPSELSAIRSSFSNVWTPRKENAPANVSYSGLFTDGFELQGMPVSVLAGASLSNSFNTRNYEQLDIRGGSANNYNARSRFDKISSTRETLLGLNGGLNFQPLQGSKVSYNFLFTHSTEDRAQIAEGKNDQSELIRQSTLEYTQRQLISHVLKGKHILPGSKTELQWIASASAAERNQPDSRFSEYLWSTLGYITDPEDEEEIIGTVDGWGKSALGFPFQRTFGESSENSKSLQLSVNRDVPGLREGWDNIVKLGWSYDERNRDTLYRVFGIRCQGCAFDGTGQGELTFSPELYENNPEFLDNLIIEENTGPLDNYRASQKNVAAFAMLSMNFGGKLNVIGGSRFENSDQNVTAGGSLGDTETVDAKLSNDDWLPAVNATFRVTNRINLRSSYSRTLNRPEMRELAPLRVFNYETGIEEQGNRFLEQARIDAYDARLEYYPGRRGYVSASVFHKDILSPIERILVPQAAGNLKEVPGNGNEGTLTGWEVEWRGSMSEGVRNIGQVAATGAWMSTRPFWLISKLPGLGVAAKLAPSFPIVPELQVPGARNLGITFNLSRIDSEVNLNLSRIEDEAQLTVDPTATIGGSSADDVYKRAPLTGQSTYAFNAGLLYGDGSRDASLMLKAFGDRLSAFGVGSPDLYERIPAVLDFAVSQKLGTSLKVKLQVENILDDRREVYYDAASGDQFFGVDGESIGDPVRSSLLDGRKIGVSVSIRR